MNRYERKDAEVETERLLREVGTGYEVCYQRSCGGTRNIPRSGYLLQATA